MKCKSCNCTTFDDARVVGDQEQAQCARCGQWCDWKGSTAELEEMFPDTDEREQVIDRTLDHLEVAGENMLAGDNADEVERMLHDLGKMADHQREHAVEMTTAIHKIRRLISNENFRRGSRRMDKQLSEMEARTVRASGS